MSHQESAEAVLWGKKCPTRWEEPKAETFCTEVFISVLIYWFSFREAMTKTENITLQALWQIKISRKKLFVTDKEDSEHCWVRIYLLE